MVRTVLCLLLIGLLSRHDAFGQGRLVEYAQFPTDASPTTIHVSDRMNVITVGYQDGSVWRYSLIDHKRALIHKHDSPVALLYRGNDQHSEVIASVAQGGNVFFFAERYRADYSWLTENHQVVQSNQGTATALVKDGRLSCRVGSADVPVGQRNLDDKESVIAVSESGMSALTRRHNSLCWLNVDSGRHASVIQDAFSEGIDDENVTAALISSERNRSAIVVLNNPVGIGANVINLSLDDIENAKTFGPFGSDACIAICKSGDVIVVGAKHIELWSTKTWTVFDKSPVLQSTARAISTSEDGSIVAAALDHGNVVLWKAEETK